MSRRETTQGPDRPSPPEADPPGRIEEALAVLATLAGVSARLDVGAGNSPSVGGTEPGSENGSGRRMPARPDERSRRLAEARYRALVEQIPAVTFLASLAGGENSIYVSPQIESLLGFSQEEWISDPVLWYRQTHPADRDRVSREFAATCLNGQPFRDVIRVLSRNGELVWVHAEARLVRDEDGQLLFLQGVGFDVTEQFKAQEARERLITEQAARAEADRERDRLLAIFTGLPAAITLLRGQRYLIEFMNPVALELAGAGPEAIGKPFGEVFPDFAAATGAAFESALTAEEPFRVTELRVADRRGSGERFFNFICQPLHDYRGALLLTHAVEVTEQVQARREVEGALRIRDEFISIAAHELRTPVATLSGHAQLALRRLRRVAELEPGWIAGVLQTITGQSEKLTRLLSQLLDVSRLEGGKLSIERQPVDLSALVEHVVAGARARTDGYVFMVDVPACLEARVDPLRLEQVLTNLLDNGVKYSPNGGPIEVVLSRPSREAVELSVRDHGLGIPPENRGRIFERFYQAHASVHRSGMGLGLYICRQIVELHDGEIRAEFPPDGGSRFVVRVPIGLDEPVSGPVDTAEP